MNYLFGLKDFTQDIGINLQKIQFLVNYKIQAFYKFKNAQSCSYYGSLLQKFTKNVVNVELFVNPNVRRCDGFYHFLQQKIKHIGILK